MPALEIQPRPTLSAVQALLASEDLPTSDLTVSQLEHFFFTGAENAPVGIVGLEIYCDVALLRSLVVQAAARRSGLGEALVRHAERYAASRRIRDLYLLTTTADKFFRRLGYQPVSRSDAPRTIQQTLEFSCLCPASSAFMMKRVQTGD